MTRAGWTRCAGGLMVMLLWMQQPAGGQSPAELFDRVDRDANGELTRGELGDDALFDRLLRGLDRNRDGVLQRTEVHAVTEAREIMDHALEVPALQMPPMPMFVTYLDVPYASIEGVDPALLSLDLYVPMAQTGDTREPLPPEAGADSDGRRLDDRRLESDARRPVMIMIHGGGWRRGDKRGAGVVGAKMRHFVNHGYIFVSINYRLSPDSLEPDRIMHPVHAEDCARALAWVHEHIESYGGDPDQLHLMGHSAGAHLAAIISTNERFLAARGKPLSIIRSAVILDSAVIDLPRSAGRRGRRGLSLLHRIAFGDDKATWRDASPQHHVGPDKSIPRMLIFYGGSRMGLDILAPVFARSLTDAGSPSQAIDTVTLTHSEINTRIGMIGDPMTPLIMRLHAGDDPTAFPVTLEQSVLKSGAESDAPGREASQRGDGDAAEGERLSGPHADADG